MSFLKNIPSNSAPDIELVQLYKSSKDLSVLSELYQRYMDLVYGVCLNYFKDPEDAKDAVLNIFEELVAKLHKYEVSNFKGWLYQLAKNHCLMILRSNKKFSKVQSDVSLMQNEETVHLNAVLEKEEHFKTLQFCLGQLVTEQKKVLELFYMEQKCYNEIVAVTGIEWNKVRSFIQNGKRNLKICMDKNKVD